MYLLDTDHESVLIRQYQPAYTNLSSRLLQAGSAVVFHSVVCFHEQVLGAHDLIKRARNPATLEQGVRSPATRTRALCPVPGD
jgi:tRNA(fMet)-specific endonuclease VapC